MPPIRVMLVDDHTIVRTGIRALLNSISGVHVVAEATDVHEAITKIDAQRPNIVVLDIMMPVPNGLSAVTQIINEHPTVRVIVLAMNSGEELAIQAIKAGASGYLLKSTTLQELESALRAVAAGETFITQAVSKYLVGALRSGKTGDDLAIPLTQRQREVLQLIAEGKSTKEIASILKISYKTAEGHRSQLMQVLDIHEIAGLVRYAIRRGLVGVS